MTVESSVKLELYWKGNYTYRSAWDIEVIDIILEEASHEIFAHIDSTHPASQEQRLTFRVCKKEAVFEPEKSCATLNCEMSIFKSIKISARIFQTYENKGRGILNSDGSISYELRSRRDNLPVFIDELPDFEPGKIYQLRIHSQDNTLKATIAKKVGEVLTTKVPSGAASSSDELNALKTAFEGLGRLVDTSLVSDPTLEGLETKELERRLEQANKQLNEARVFYQRSIQEHGDINRIMANLQYKQDITREILSLQKVLETRQSKKNAPSS